MLINMMTKMNRWLGERMFVVVLSALLLGFFVPVRNTPEILSHLAVVLFAYMSFISALGTSFKDFYQILTRPWVPLWIFTQIHIVVPAIAWVIGWVLYPTNYLTRLGLLIAACIPVGVTSIIWTSLTEGSVALAIVVVTLDTLLVPIVLPLTLYIIAGHSVELDYSQMVFQLLNMVTIPTILGMVVNEFTKAKLKHFVESTGGFTSKVALFLVIFFNSIMIASDINWDYGIIKLLLVVFLLVAFGYLLGFLASRIISKQEENGISQAMIYTIGMRNITFGSLLALAYFPSTVAIPITLAMLFQQPLAGAVSQICKKWLVGKDLRERVN